jgi:hypothetical protein
MARRPVAPGVRQPVGTLPQVYIPGGTPAAMVPLRRPSGGPRRPLADAGGLGCSLMVQSVTLRRSIDRYGAGGGGGSGLGGSGCIDATAVALQPAAPGAVEPVAGKVPAPNHSLRRLDAPRSPQQLARGPAAEPAKSAWPSSSVQDPLHPSHKDLLRLQHADPRVHGMAGRFFDAGTALRGVGDARVLLADVMRARQQNHQGWVQTGRAGIPANPAEAGKRLGPRSSVGEAVATALKSCEGSAAGPRRASNTSRDYAQARMQGHALHMSIAHHPHDTQRAALVPAIISSICGADQAHELLGTAQTNGLGTDGPASVMVMSLRNQLQPHIVALHGGRVSNRRTLPLRPSSGQPLGRSSSGAGGAGAVGPVHVWSYCNSPQASSEPEAYWCGERGQVLRGALPSAASPSRPLTNPTDKEGPAGGSALRGESSDASGANTDEASGCNTPDHETPHAPKTNIANNTNNFIQVHSRRKPDQASEASQAPESGATCDMSRESEAKEGEGEGATVRGTHDAGTTSPSVPEKGRGSGWINALSRLSNSPTRKSSAAKPVWGGNVAPKGSPTKGVPFSKYLDAGGEDGSGSKKPVKRALERLQEEPPPKTNTLTQIRQFVAATDEKWQRARKAQQWHFRGSAAEEKQHKEQLALFRQRRGLDERKIMAVCGGNKTARETLTAHDCQECPEGDLDTTNFDVRWTINHGDINFAEVRPSQMCNHFPNSGIEVGSKVGLARNLRSLEWFDKVDMNTFFPRMYNLANPWEMQVSIRTSFAYYNNEYKNLRNYLEKNMQMKMVYVNKLKKNQMV